MVNGSPFSSEKLRSLRSMQFFSPESHGFPKRKAVYVLEIPSDSRDNLNNKNNPKWGYFYYERVTGVGPVSLPWQGSIIPLYDTRG